MANTFSLKILATDRMIYDGECESLVLPATDGEYAILANHEPLLIALVMGELRYRINDEKNVYLTGNGFCYVNDNQVVVEVETAERPEEIDERRAKEAAERAEERLRQKRSKQSFHESEAALSRAMSRMKEAARHRRGF